VRDLDTEHIDDLRDFAGRSWGGVDVARSMAEFTELKLAVTPERSAAQETSLRRISPPQRSREC
jgi:hypothetical protein